LQKNLYLETTFKYQQFVFALGFTLTFLELPPGSDSVMIVKNTHVVFSPSFEVSPYEYKTRTVRLLFASIVKLQYCGILLIQFPMN
jgi:hypothetical protein